MEVKEEPVEYNAIVENLNKRPNWSIKNEVGVNVQESDVYNVPIIKTEELDIKEEDLSVTVETHEDDTEVSSTENIFGYMTTRTGEKPYACSVCEFKTALKRNLNNHMRTHTEKKPYNCNICEYKTGRKQHLIDHMRAHTGEKPYVCSVCNHSSVVKQNLKVHMRTHTGEKPYACNVCDYKTAWKRYLKVHISTHK